MKQHYQKMFDYNKWANDLFLNCLENHTVTNARVFLLMSHILTAEEIWLCRLTGRPAPIQNLWKELPLQELHLKAKEQSQAWNEHLEYAKEPGLQKEVEYANSRGVVFFTSVTDILNHVINHGTYHRGQIANLLKLEAIEPPLSDYIAYVRQLGK